MKNKYEAIVVGAGHAGVEAALSLARRKHSTALITISIEHMSKMPCNPSIGGPAKGIVVREIDALGGQMGKSADKTALQFKMLNTTKGPGVWSLRVQSDKLEYSRYNRKVCQSQENLDVIEDIVEGIIVENNEIKGVTLKNNGELYSEVVILTTGTYMASTTMISAEVKSEGPDGEATTNNLSKSLLDNGIELFRLKTGTPPRILTSSIDFSKTKYEPGTNDFIPFSYETKEILPFESQTPCYLTYTTAETKQIILDNLNKSSMYSGVVKGVGPRYCPSIEDKIVRFSDKPRHQLFLEPESLELDTTYLQGFSSSMPRDVQEKMVHTIIGLENCVIKKYAYAIEYDAINPLEVKSNMELKKIKNLFIGGQIFGTSGYEEAAGLGLMAGINAGNKLENKEPLVLSRSESYIGVMIDDLVTKGTNEPYRLLTSRAEYRLLLRHDNADQRLTEYGHNIGLISEERYHNFLKKLDDIKEMKQYLREHTIKFEGYGVNGYDYLKRSDYSRDTLLSQLEINDLDILKQCEIEIKYEGYIVKQEREAERIKKLDLIKLSQDIDYDKVDNLSLEARQKLNKIKPSNIGEASRISGINPSDIQVLAMYVKKEN